MSNSRHEPNIERVLIRTTIRDADQTISFLANLDTVLQLVAGCSIDPKNLGELLIATDTYQSGFAAAVMADLMDFDKSLSREGSHFIHDAISLARAQGKTVDIASQVFDENTELEALRPRECELVIFDLTQYLIEVSKGLDIPRAGEVYIRTTNGKTESTVAFILPRNWTMQSIE
jgi:hypothetical protein